MVKKIFLTLFFLLVVGVKCAYADVIGFIWAIGVFIVDTIWAHPIIAAVTTVSIGYSLYEASKLDKLKAPSAKYSAPIIDNTYSNEGIVPLLYGGPIVVGGNIIWESDPGTTMQRFLAFSIGEVANIGNVKIDDVHIGDLTGCSYTAYYGTAGQAVDSRAAGAVKGLHHVVYIAATITAGDKVSSNPIVSAEITGRKIQTWNSTAEDWTTNSLAYSKNPAAIVRDYLLLSSVLGGCGVPSAYVDDESFGEISEICDELVDNGAGGTEKRYELDIIIDTRHAALDNLDKMMITFNAGLIHSGATYKLVIEKSAETAVQAFTEDNIIKGTFVYGYGKADETPNKMGVEWIEALEPKNPKRIAWAEDELDQDIRGVRDDKIEMYGIIRQSQALRQAKKILYDRKLNDIWCQFECNMSAMHCEPFDVTSVTHTRPNWTAAAFRIMEMNEVDFGRAKFLLQAYNESVLDDAYGATFDNWDYGAPVNPYLPIPDATDLAISEIGWRNAEGTYVIHIDVSWTAPPSRREDIDMYVIELKKASDNYLDIGQAPASATTYRINLNLEAGVAYTVRIKTKSKEGIISDGAVSNTITLVGKNRAPSDVSGFVYSWGSELEITWNFVVGTDIAGYEVRDEDANWGTDGVHLIYRGSVNRKILIPSTRAPGTYYVKAYNTGLVYSETATSIVPTNSVPSTPLVTLTNWFGFAILDWTDDSEPDIQYYQVYKSTSNLWTGEETLYSKISGKSAPIQGKAPVDAVADAADATSITDADLIGKGVDYFVGDKIKQTSGTYENQEALITAFDNTTGKVTVASWPSGTPSVADNFVLKDRAYFKVRGVDRYGPGTFSSSVPIDFVQLSAGEIGDEIISARKVTTGELITLTAQIKDAIINSAKILDLDADKINVGTLTGFTIQTATSGSRVLMDTDKLVCYDDAAAEVFKVLITGDDVGDVIFGSASDTAKQMKWDKSENNLYLRGSPISSVLIASAANVTYYVSTSGDDGNAGTSGSPFRTIQHAVDLFPKIINHNYTIYLQDSLTYDEEVTLSGFSGSGRIGIYSASNNEALVLWNSDAATFNLYCLDCDIFIHIQGISFMHKTIAMPCIGMLRCQNAWIIECGFSDNGVGGANSAGCKLGWGRYYIDDLDDYDANKCTYGVWGTLSAHVGYLDTVFGDTTFLADNGAIITAGVIDPTP